MSKVLKDVILPFTMLVMTGVTNGAAAAGKIKAFDFSPYISKDSLKAGWSVDMNQVGGWSEGKKVELVPADCSASAGEYQMSISIQNSKQQLRSDKKLLKPVEQLFKLKLGGLPSYSKLIDRQDKPWWDGADETPRPCRRALNYVEESSQVWWHITYELNFEGGTPYNNPQGFYKDPVPLGQKGDYIDYLASQLESSRIICQIDRLDERSLMVWGVDYNLDGKAEGWNSTVTMKGIYYPKIEAGRAFEVEILINGNLKWNEGHPSYAGRSRETINAMREAEPDVVEAYDKKIKLIIDTFRRELELLTFTMEFEKPIYNGNTGQAEVQEGAGGKASHQTDHTMTNESTDGDDKTWNSENANEDSQSDDDGGGFPWSAIPLTALGFGVGWGGLKAVERFIMPKFANAAKKARNTAIPPRKHHAPHVHQQNPAGSAGSRGLPPRRETMAAESASQCQQAGHTTITPRNEAEASAPDSKRQQTSPNQNQVSRNQNLAPQHGHTNMPKHNTLSRRAKTLSMAIAGGIAVLALCIWGIVRFCGNGGGNDGGEDNDYDSQDANKFVRMMSPASLDSLVQADGFPATKEDVAPLKGDYEVTVERMVINLILQPDQHGMIVGKAKMKLGGRTRMEGVYAYCGNSIYAIYEDEEGVGGKPHNYFYAMPDRKSVMMIDGEQYILVRKTPPPTVETDEDFIYINKKSDIWGYFLTNADGTISIYDDGEELARLKKGKTTTLNID